MEVLSLKMRRYRLVNRYNEEHPTIDKTRVGEYPATKLGASTPTVDIATTHQLHDGIHNTAKGRTRRNRFADSV